MSRDNESVDGASRDDESRQDATGSSELLQRARRGDRSAIDALFARLFPWLRQRTSGRLPRWVRGVLDTSDIVQDVFLHTMRRISGSSRRVAACSEPTSCEPSTTASATRCAVSHGAVRQAISTRRRCPRPAGALPRAACGRRSLETLPARPEAADRARAPADRRPRRARVLLQATRAHRRPRQCRRGAQSATACPGSTSTEMDA